MAWVSFRVVRRLAQREYAPLAAWLSCWLLLAVALGHADAVRLLAAHIFVQAARTLGTLRVMPLLRPLVGSDPAVWRQSRARALILELGGLLASVVIVAALVGFLIVDGAPEVGAMVAIIAGGLPARHPGQLLVAARARVVAWRLGAGATIAIGAAAILFWSLGWQAAAIVLGLREWGGLLAALAFAPARKSRKSSEAQPVTFTRAAEQTEHVARRQLTYRIFKGAMSLALGPAGAVLARTGRGARLDSRISRFVPRHRGGMAAFALTTAAAAAAILLLSKEPSALLLGAVFTRFAASSGAALLWWRYGGEGEAVDDEDDEI
jgi:hypothetical protein